MTWIQTYTGRKFSLLDPQPEDVEIEDIVASLGNTCRFNGHCRKFYSVLEHSVRVAAILPLDMVLCGLLHDAGEAYYGDITRPMKGVLRSMTQPHHSADCRIDAFFDRIDAAIAERFRIPHPLPSRVKHADDTLLSTEARDIMMPSPEPWVDLPIPLTETIVPYEPQAARYLFCSMFHDYR